MVAALRLAMPRPGASTTRRRPASMPTAPRAARASAKAAWSCARTCRNRAARA